MLRELTLRRPHDRDPVGEGRSVSGAGGMRHSSVNLNCRAGEDPQAGVETSASLVKPGDTRLYDRTSTAYPIPQCAT